MPAIILSSDFALHHAYYTEQGGSWSRSGKNPLPDRLSMFEYSFNYKFKVLESRGKFILSSFSFQEKAGIKK